MHTHGRTVTILMATVLAAALPACSGSLGYIRGAVSDTSFIKDKDVLYVETELGIERMLLDGSGRRVVFPPGLLVHDLAPDGRWFALGDADTNLFLGDAETGERIRIHELDGRCGEVAFSTDGRTLAATRHADFSLPQVSWKETEDDRVYLVDVATRKVKELPAARQGMVTFLAWSKDGTALFLGDIGPDKFWEKIDLTSEKRSEVGEWPYSQTSGHGYLPSPVCRLDGSTTVRHVGWRGDKGLEVVTQEGTRRKIVTVEGRERGLHDYTPTIDFMFFSKSCRFAVFSHNQQIWVVEIPGGTVAAVAKGYLAFPDR